jgi:hypothetical protein
MTLLQFYEAAKAIKPNLLTEVDAKITLWGKHQFRCYIDGFGYSDNFYSPESALESIKNKVLGIEVPQVNMEISEDLQPELPFSETIAPTLERQNSPSTKENVIDINSELRKEYIEQHVAEIESRGDISVGEPEIGDTPLAEQLDGE